jgi:hypothetical protein
MKRFALILITLFLLIATFWSCDLFTKDAVTALVYVEHYYAGRRAPDWDVTYVPSVWVRGQVSGTQLPAFDFLQVGDKVIEGKDIYTNQQGYVYFSSDHRVWEDSIAAPAFDPLTITVATDIGSVTGSVTIPDTLTSLTISVLDTVALGTPVTVSWTGGNADYYQVCYYHFWEEDSMYWSGYSKDTVVTGNSVTFDSTYFTKNAELSDFEIYPINGPIPVAGATPNMTGDGVGYLYSENQEITSDALIVFGEGINIPDFGKRPVKEINTPESRQESLKKRLGL